MAKKTKVSQGTKKQSVGQKMTGVKKGNTKTVSTNLKKMNFHNKTKTADVDKKFADIRKLVVAGEEKKTKSKHEVKRKQKKSPTDHAPLPDVESAMDSMESLTMPGS